MTRKIRDFDEILRAASDAFIERGFEHARVEDIASSLGILKSSLYHHVSGKSELMYLVVREVIQRRIAWVAEVLSDESEPPRVRLEKAVRGHLCFFLTDRTAPLVQASSLDGMSEEHRAEAIKLFSTYGRLFGRILRDAIEAGDIRSDIDASVLVQMLFGMLNSVPHWYDPAGRLDEHAVLEQAFSLCMSGLVGPPADGAPPSPTP
ncbi:MAG TPA: TetR/AcrR family transcriptional regulator [Tepidiformaceae bacterium]|nr:TetR/AcrR family transcriptional regulator [Tepidiformaceae bacterium]